MDEEEALFRQSLLAFPSSFNLEIKELKNSEKIVLFKKKVEENVRSDRYDSTTERIRMYNLLTFLKWRAKERDDAYSYNRKALDLDKENIVSLFNRLWMRREEGHLTESNEELSRLVKLAEPNNDLLLAGIAEIAYCYPIFGPSYLLKAKDMLEDVVRELSGREIHPDTIFSLKLDLGIVYRKLCNFGNMPKKGWEKRKEEECIKRGAELLYEVACSDSPAKWKGRSWVSLAEISYIKSKGVTLNKYEIEELFPEKIKELSIENLLDLALKECDDDSHILKVCGKLYRYLHKLDKAEDVLRKSLIKEKTAYAHHQLALVLKQRLKDKLFAKRGYNKETRDRYDPVGTSIHHKTFLPNVVSQESQGNFVPFLNSAREYDDSSQEFSETKTRAIVAETEQPISAISEKETRGKSATDEANINLQYRNTKRTTRAVAKAFDRVFSIPENEGKIVKEILYNLDEAIHFGNEWASLEKGIVLRQIHKFKEARDVFLMTLKMEESNKAIIEVSCYENIGNCCRDIAEQEDDSDQKRKFEIDAVIYWRKALDIIASKEGKTLKFLREEWMSYPVLKNMFQHRELDVAMLKALANLGEILERPAETRSIIQKIRKLDGDEANDPTIISREIKTLLKEHRYEDAAQLLDKSEKEGIEINTNFRLRVYLECAFYLVTIGKRENACEQFQQAFHVNSIANSKFDIFLLYDEDKEAEDNIADLAKKLEEFLSENFRLRITRNSQNVKPGKRTWDIQTEQMESSKHIVLIMDTNEEPRDDFKYFIGIAQEISKTEKSILNILLLDECTCPLQLTNFSKMHFETKQLSSSNDDFIQWIRYFIFRLLRVNNNDD
ncbi:hypothetical protein ACJMK2_027640 [Sinanodonta woodiana]|uniref:TIR domain-containing protein n=1 Tax=Sinanodonta woodiana TaxID=1069815 RepID=A0ABD3X862_SINWO